MMTVTKPAGVRNGPERDLAEGRWFWRRLIVFGATFGLWALLALAVDRATPEGLPRIADGLMGLLGLILVLYLVAPTAQHLVEIVVNLKLRLGPGGRR